jgi:predicted transcriptional regulator of viral defense system
MLTINEILNDQLEGAKQRIETTFDSQEITALGARQLQFLLQKNCSNWEVSPDISFTKFLNFMLKRTKLREITLKSANYDSQTRYVWGNPSVHAVALSLKSNSYLSHETAVFLHGLANGSVKRIYVNREQSQKPKGGGLSQESLSKAFSNKQRESKLMYAYQRSQIVMLNGMFTDRLGVEKIRSKKGELLDVTSLERTLIDVTVRPNYAGGSRSVLETFRRARGRVSVDALLTILKHLEYVYPYHQAIGFYLERADYPRNDWTPFMKLGISFDFYLTHALPPERKYDSTWRLYYPPDLITSS